MKIRILHRYLYCVSVAMVIAIVMFNLASLMPYHILKGTDVRLFTVIVGTFSSSYLLWRMDD